MTAAVISISRCLNSARPWVRARNISSQTPITETSEESFSMAMNWLPVGGTISFIAWGRTILRMIRPASGRARRRLALAGGTPWMPARKISAM